MIRQREGQPISHWQRTLALPPITAVSLVLCATTAIGTERDYTAAFEDAFNMTMPPAWSQNYPATQIIGNLYDCLLYTSPSPRDSDQSRMPSSA